MAIRDVFHSAETIKQNVDNGVWANTTLDDCLQQHARERGGKVALVDRRWRLTFTELNRLAHRAACGLLQLGVTNGDVISLQTPNWAEWLIMHCAATKVGAVTNSIGAVYRHREVHYILNYAESVLMLIPETFRNFSYTDMLSELRSNLPNLRNVLVIGRAAGHAVVPRFPRYTVGSAISQGFARLGPAGSAPSGDPNVHFRDHRRS
jgi:non-ribosomal peptide synthetase component E (peptide arylation enzyme)